MGYRLKNRIRRYRIQEGLSQTELAALAKTTQNTISSLETGQYSPTAYTALLIAMALGKKFDDVFYLE